MPKPSINHILQPKHTVLPLKEADKILEEFNISHTQLPKMKITDPALPEGANVGDMIKIERKDEDGKITPYFRVVVLTGDLYQSKRRIPYKILSFSLYL